MGGTWKTKSMFDLDFNEDSFCKLLNDSGIETFTFDIPETNHNDVVSICQDLINANNIKNIMGYSYGCLPAIDLSLCNNLNSLVLLDPFSGLKINKQEHDDRLYYKSSDVYDVVTNNCYLSQSALKSYIDSLGESFSVSNFPKKFSSTNFDKYTDWRLHRSIRCNKFVAFTESSKQEMHVKFSTIPRKFYKSSHWILIEEGRKSLCEDVCAVLK